MTISTGLVPIEEAEVAATLEEHLLPRLAALVTARGAGHCMRCDDLDAHLAIRLVRRLRSSTSAQIHVLGGPPRIDADVAASSTKIVELRNPDESGELRAPLLVLVPPGTHASAEDSFGVATFEQVDLGGVHAAVRENLLAALPDELRRQIRELFGVLDEGRWDPADARARVRYLLTVARNDHDPAAAGAAVYELGLIPDPELFTRAVAGRASRNLATVQQIHTSALPDRQRILSPGLTDLEFRRRAAAFAATTGLGDPLKWTRAIVIDRDNWTLFFGHWPLRAEERHDAIGVQVGELDLPVAGDDAQHATNPALRGITGQRFLLSGPGGPRDLVVPFTVDRDPRRVAGLTRFRAQLMAEQDDGGSLTGVPTEVTGTVAVSKTSRSAYKVKLAKLGRAGLEEGWHYVRVTGIDGDNLPIPHAGQGDGARPPHESDRFYVLADSEQALPPPPQRTRRDPGATQAARVQEFAAADDGRAIDTVVLSAVRWQDPPRGSASAGPRVAVCDFGAAGLSEVTVSPILAAAQRQMLAEPAAPAHWRLHASAVQPRPAVAVAEPSRWSEAADPEARAAFLRTRKTLWERIVAATAGSTATPAVEACDLHAFADEVTTYVESYRSLLDGELRRAQDGTSAGTGVLADLLRVDTVALHLIDHRGVGRDVVLVSPLHPQRLLWTTAWAALANEWATAPADRALRSGALQELLGLRPLGHPFVIPRGGGRLAVAVADLTDYWGMLLPDGTTDAQGLLGLVQTALDVPRRAEPSDVWSSAALADRFHRYLRQHPYVRTLVIDAINVGRAEEIAGAVRRLRDRFGWTGGVDLRLYAADPEAPGTADAAVELLIGPDALRGIALAVRARAEYGSGSGDDAHICVLFDALSAERIGTGLRRAIRRRALPLNGLVQQVEIDYSDADDAPTVWRKRPVLSDLRRTPGGPIGPDLLHRLPLTVATAAAAVATGRVRPDRVPEVSLTLTGEDSALLDIAHRRSDWVITVDRTLGVEFFDGPRRPQRPDHVIDHVTETGTPLGHHMVVSSRSLIELRGLLEPILRESGLDIVDRHVATFFDQLRLLSGRLAFKIASLAPSQRMEVLGLALARLHLEASGALRDSVVVPLDAHLELYQEARRVDDGTGLRRTDLALFGVDLAARTITCRLLEVKCSTGGLGIGEYQQLKTTIRAQVDRSAEVLASHFDPTAGPRPDRPARNLQLATLVRFYLQRARRHRIIADTAGDQIDELLDTLDEGFHLSFTKSGLIVDLNGGGAEPETDGGVTYLGLGRRAAQDLLDGVPTGPLPGPAGTGTSVDPTPPAPTPPGSERRSDSEPEPAVPQQDLVPEPERATPRMPDVVVGSTRPTPQYGILGETTSGQTVAIDLNETHTVSLFGVQGGGKSYTLGSLIESATLPAAPLNHLQAPLATIVFHYSATQDYAPEFTSMIDANDDEQARARLRDRYGVDPQALRDVVLLTPRDKLEQRTREYPGIEVRPLLFSSAELQVGHWLFLMGAVGNDATYIRQLKRLMRQHRNDLRLDTLRAAVDSSSMAASGKQLATGRLDMAGDYIDDASTLRDLVRPGRLIIVDLRDEMIGKDEALGLFVVLMQLFAEARGVEHFNKLVVFDEAHKYIDNPDLVKGLVETVREMRHKGMSVLVASQDPPSVPVSLIELSDHIIVHKFTSPSWLKHLQKANAALSTITPERLAELRPGEAYLWASKSTDRTFTERMVKIRTRPRLTRHGGSTRTAVQS